MDIVKLPEDRASEAVDVLQEAFRDYPFLRFVIGPTLDEYETHLRALVDFFTRARFAHGDPVFGAIDAHGQLVGVANVTVPGPRRPAPDLVQRRAALWERLGPSAQARYETYGVACQAFWNHSPRYHVNMVGVRRRRAGQGIGRSLLEAVHRASSKDPRSTGVALTTEDPANVPLYQHLGYSVTGTATLSDSLQTWGFFRPDQAPGASVDTAPANV